MDITALPSLTDLFEGADQWGEVLSLLPVLVLLELILSADNAVALAAIARSSRQAEQERLALNIGIGLAMVLRIGLIVLAQWVLQNSWVQLLAAAYLFWLFISHLIERNSAGDDGDPTVVDSPKRNLFQTVVLRSQMPFVDLLLVFHLIFFVDLPQPKLAEPLAYCLQKLLLLQLVHLFLLALYQNLT